MVAFFWGLLTVGFAILTIMDYRQYWKLSSSRRAIELGKLVGLPDGITPFQDHFGELMRLLSKDLFLGNTFGFIFALFSALYIFIC